MAHVDEMLLPDETVLCRGRLHRAAVALPVVNVTLAGAALHSCAGIAVAAPTSGSRAIAGVAVAAATLGLVGGVVHGVASYLTYFVGDEVAVTSRRLIVRLGAVRRREFAYPFRGIDSIAVDRGRLGGLIGGARLKVLGAGHGWIRTPRLSNFREVREATLRQIEAASASS